MGYCRSAPDDRTPYNGAMVGRKMKRHRTGICAIVAVCALGSTCAWAEPPAPPAPPAPAPVAPVALGDRYSDSLNGFSLRPPAGARLNRGIAGSRLVSWSLIDAKAGAMVWTLSVRRARGTIGTMGLKEYADALAGKLRKEESFGIESVRLSPVGGRPAIHFRGRTGGMMSIWQSQVWISTRPGIPGGEAGQFLILSIVGSTEIQKQLDAICTTVVDTVRLTDPETAKEIMRENLKRGYTLLAGVDGRKIGPVLHATDRWYLLQAGGKALGFTRVREGTGLEKRAAGYQVTTWSVATPPRGDLRVLKRVLFTTPDRRVERWKEQVQVGQGDRARSVAIDGIKQADLIVCSVDRGGNIDSMQQILPQRDVILERMKKKAGEGVTVRPEDVVIPEYLPRALGGILGRLIDLSTPGAYAFAVFNVETGDLDMRTYTVVGPETILLGGKQVKAVRILDRPAQDQEPVTTWLDEKGGLLRRRTPEGTVMELSSRPAILAKFPAADKVIQGMAKWASQK